MAGHSKFKNIMHRKGAQDRKRTRIFSRLAREITVAARLGGVDPNANPRLRLAMQEARGQNMPKDNIERAIAKVEGGAAEDLEEIVYEGYGPGGVAFVVEAMTDNRNRTAASIRSCFNRHGGSLAEGGAVTFQFERVGEIVFGPGVADADAVLEAAIEAGADDAVTEEDGHRIRCSREGLAEVSRELEVHLGNPPGSSRLVWSPLATVPVGGEDANRVVRLYAALNDDDDVQEVYANFEIPDELLEDLAA